MGFSYLLILLVSRKLHVYAAKDFKIWNLHILFYSKINMSLYFAVLLTNLANFGGAYEIEAIGTKFTGFEAIARTFGMFNC